MKLHMHLLEMEITNRCNLNCAHCYNRGETKEDMPFPEMIELFHFAQKYGVSKLVISGGEACLHQKLPEFLSYISNHKQRTKEKMPKIVLQSNGKIRDYLSTLDLSGVDLVHLSFDIDENGVRKIDENETVQLAKQLKEKGVQAYFFATIHKNNQNHIEEMVEIANKNQIPIAFNLCSETGKNEEILLTKEERIQAYKKLLAYEKKGKIRPVKHPHLAVLRYTEEELKQDDKIHGGCTAGIGSCSVLSNGDVIPCPFLRKKAGNIREKGEKNIEETLVDIWLHAPLFTILRKRNEYAICKDCKYLNYCGGCRSSAMLSTEKINGFDRACLKKIS